MNNNIIDLFQGNTYHDFNLESGFGVFNMFLNKNNQMRSTPGYKAVKNEKFATGKYLAYIITKDDNTLLIADETGIVVLQYNPVSGDVQQPIPKIFFKGARLNQNEPYNPDPNCYSMVLNERGTIFVTDGSEQGLYALQLLYQPNGQLSTEIFFQQIDFTAFSPSFVIQKPAQLAYLDTHIIVVNDATGGMNVITGLYYNFETNSLNYTTTTPQPPVTITDTIYIQSSPCNITAVKRIERSLYVIGTQCIEVWYSSASNQPIARYPNVLEEVGVTSRKVITDFNGKLIFVGSSKDKENQIYIWDVKSGRPKAVGDPNSTNNINYLFTIVKNFSDITVTTFGSSGQEFAIINFGGRTGLNFSILLNIETEQSFYLVDIYKGKKTRFLADSIFRFQGQNFFISWNINRLYKFDNKYTQYGENPIECSIRTNQSLFDSARLMQISNLIVNFAPIPEYYYSGYQKDCVPVLQQNTNTAFRILTKTPDNTWVQFNNGFFPVNRKTFHKIIKGNITVKYNPQILIEFFQATSMKPFIVQSNIRNLQLTHFPIILNGLQITAQEK